MKENDYSVIQTTVQSIITNNTFEIKDVIDTPQLTAIVANIYINADTSKAVTNHVDNICTVIATIDRISIILDDKSSYIKLQEPIVAFDNLVDDIFNILECMDICLIRINE